MMSRRTAPSTITGLLVILSTIISGCSHSEKNATGFWATEGVILRISREGEHGEYYIVEWKEPGRIARGSFSGLFRDAKIISGDPTSDLTYSRGLDVLIWRGKTFYRVSPEDYARTAPQ
jgi:hypothetical protein